jgi:hypothetical protein
VCGRRSSAHDAEGLASGAAEAFNFSRYDCPRRLPWHDRASCCADRDRAPAAHRPGGSTRHCGPLGDQLRRPHHCLDVAPVHASHPALARRGSSSRTEELPVGTSADVRFGSEMGALGRCQVRSEAVTGPGQTSLTCGCFRQQRLCRGVRSVRDEEAAGSNPATPTQLTGHSPKRDVAFFYAVRQQNTATAYSPSCLPSRLSALASETSV